MNVLKRFIIALGCFFFLVPSVSAVNLLQNADFESGTISPWATSGGSAEVTLSSDLIHNGSYALKIRHDKTSSYGFQQVIPNIEEGMFYEVSGYAATKDSNVATYLLRIAWYNTSDGSGSQLASPMDSQSANNTDGQWVFLQNLVQAPQNSKSAKVRLVLTTKTAGTNASVYFDDISFQESIAPTFTPTSIPTNTNIPTPTSIPKNTTTPTNTVKSTNTPTPNKSITPTKALQKDDEKEENSSSSQDLGTVLGETTPFEATTGANISNTKPWIIGALFIAGGLGFMSLALLLHKQFFPKQKSDILEPR